MVSSLKKIKGKQLDHSILLINAYVIKCEKERKSEPLINLECLFFSLSLFSMLNPI
jgi:hypothetical protein